MKVLCINKMLPLMSHPALWAAFHKLKVLDIYTVMNEEIGSYSNRGAKDLFYELGEFPPVWLPDYGRKATIIFEAKCFIPISDSDENLLAYERWARRLETISNRIL